ncbi:MAG: tripartite tricarboxylate transporter permease [Chloroflexota bacterium]
MLEAYGQALSFLLSPMTLLLMLGAVIIGLIIGIIPGIGGLIGVALFLPLVFRMPAETALTFLITFHAVTMTGGSISAILVNVPGTGANAATLLDGFPMNQKGEGARAVGAAVTASTFGGLVPCFLALAMIPLVYRLVIAFRSPEMAMLVLLGISFIAVLTGRSKTRGLASGTLGVLISLIGFQNVTGTYRFTLGSEFLYSGLEIVAMALGLFGLAELFDVLMKGHTSITSTTSKQSLADALQGALDVWRHKWVWLQGTIIGYIIGVIPGVGAETGTFVAYGQAKKTSKHPELFGTGIVEGIIAPESANNAKESGALLTTMAFGIPGSAIFALFMGAFLMVGVIPGPRMLVDHLPLALIMILGIALANLIGGIISLLAAPYLARATSVHIDFLFPIILCLIITGGYIVRNTMMNVVAVIILGLLGLLMKRYDFSRPAMLLGFVLGQLFENYVLLSYQVSGPLFFVTPISMALFAFIVLLFVYPLLKKFFRHWLPRRVRA